MKFNKKAGLEMSINAIVILVMAMVVLGLGLGFIRGMFGNATAKLENSIGAVDLTNPPNAENPIVFESSTLKVKPGKNLEFNYGFYNAESDTAQDVQLEMVAEDCQGTADERNFNLITVSSDVASGESLSFKGILEAQTADGNAAPGTYLCPVTISSDGVVLASAQITIVVSS